MTSLSPWLEFGQYSFVPYRKMVRRDAHLGSDVLSKANVVSFKVPPVKIEGCLSHSSYGQAAAFAETPVSEVKRVGPIRTSPQCRTPDKRRPAQPVIAICNDPSTGPKVALGCIAISFVGLGVRILRAGSTIPARCRQPFRAAYADGSSPDASHHKGVGARLSPTMSIGVGR
jgi:hypothetical protein